MRQRKQDRIALRALIVDSGATSHYVRTSDKLPHIGPSNKSIHLPNGQVVKSAAQVKLPFEIKEQARIAELVPAIRQNSLISVGKLADTGYKTVFLPGQQGVRVLEGDSSNATDGKTVLQGWREDGGS